MNIRQSIAAMTVAMCMAAAIFGTGCDSSKTETGYTPRRVGMSNAELRTLYAPAFSPEAHAEEKKADIGGGHRPGS